MNQKQKKIILITGTILWFLFCFNVVAKTDSSSDSNENIEQEMKLMKDQVDQINKIPRPSSMSLKELLTRQYSDKELDILLGPISSISEKDLKKLIMMNKDINPVLNFLSQHPQFLIFFVRILKDKKALLGLLDIRNQKNKIYAYLIFIIFSMLINYLMKKNIAKKIESFGARVTLHFFRMFFINVVRLAIFFAIFYPQISPTLDIFYSL